MQPTQSMCDSGQEFIRDLSTAVIKLFSEECIKGGKNKAQSKTSDDSSSLTTGDVPEHCASMRPMQTCEDGLTILEALSFTGLTSIRYAKDIPGITKIVACNSSEEGVMAIKANIVANNVENLVSAISDTAPMIMYKHRKHSERFNVVDIDPGKNSVSKYLDTAVQCVSDGGLLLVTCRDTSIGSSPSLEECYGKYGAVMPKIASWREMSLRVVLKCIESHANRNGRYIEPLLSVCADDCLRVFVKVFIGPVICKQTLSKLSMVYQCVGCHSFQLQPLGLAEKFGDEKNRYKFSLPRGPPVEQHCQHCNSEHNVGGPVWSDPIHNESFVTRLEELTKTNEFSTGERMKSVLAAIQQELKDVCLYFTLDDLHSVIPTSPPIPMLELRSALLNAGYRVSCSHAQEGSLKTDATSLAVWDVIRRWALSHPSDQAQLDATARTLLSTSPNAEESVGRDLSSETN